MDLIQRLIDKFGYTEAFWQWMIATYFGSSIADAEEMMGTDPGILGGFTKSYKSATGIDASSGGGGGMTFKEIPPPEQFPRGYVPAFDYSSDSYYWKYVGEAGEAPSEPNVNEPYYWSGSSWQANPYFVTDAEKAEEAQRRLDSERNYALSQQELVNRMSQSAQGLEQQRLATAQSQMMAMAEGARNQPHWKPETRPEDTPFNWINQWKFQHRAPQTGPGMQGLARGSAGSWISSDSTGQNVRWGIADTAEEAAARGLERWSTNEQANQVMDKWGLRERGWQVLGDEFVPPQRTLYESGGTRVDVPGDVTANIEVTGAIRDLIDNPATSQGWTGSPFDMNIEEQMSFAKTGAVPLSAQRSAYAAAGPKVPMWATDVIPQGARITPGSSLTQAPGGLAARWSTKKLKKTGIAPVGAQTWSKWLPSEQQGYQGLAQAAYGPKAEDFLAKAQRAWPAAPTFKARRKTPVYT